MSTSTDAKETFATGAQRDTRTGKGRYDLISTHAMKRLALRLEQGANHYGDRNWEKGMPLMRCVDSLKRHLDQWIEGDYQEDHLAGVLFNAMALTDMDTRMNRGELDDTILDDRPYRATLRKPPIEQLAEATRCTPRCTYYGGPAYWDNNQQCWRCGTCHKIAPFSYKVPERPR